MRDPAGRVPGEQDRNQDQDRVHSIPAAPIPEAELSRDH
jgi:hypothetical protein